MTAPPTGTARYRVQTAAGLLLGLGVLGASLRGIIEFPVIWLHVGLGYGVLLVLDGIGQRDGKGSWLFSRNGAFLYAGSVVLWLGIESLNFYADAWFYTELPPERWSRWAALILLFGAVLPALVATTRLIGAIPAPRRFAIPPEAVHLGLPRRQVQGAVAIAVFSILLSVIWKSGIMFVLVSLAFVAELIVVRAASGRSMFHAWTPSHFWIVLPMSMLAWFWGAEVIGAVAGTVVRGHDDFPWVWLLTPMYLAAAFAALDALGIVHIPYSANQLRPFRVGVAAVVAAGITAIGMWQVDHRTVSSIRHPISILPGYDMISSAQWEAEGITDAASFVRAFDGVNANTNQRAARLGVDSAQLLALSELVALSQFRNIGVTHTIELAEAGVGSVCALATEDPEEVWITIHALYRGLGPRPSRAEVAGWRRAADRQTDCAPS